MSKWQEYKETVLAAARKMLEKGLIVGTSGNVSLRLPAEGSRSLLAITPSSRYYDTLSADDIQILDFDLNHVEGYLRPSMETALHIGIYQCRKDIGAIMHTHSTYASAISVAGLDIPPILDDQVVFLGGEIKLAGRSPGDGESQIDAILETLGDRNAVLLANHGAIGVGGDMREALTACELTERTAEVYWLALSAGKVNTIDRRGTGG